MSYAQTKAYSEALVNVLVTIIAKTRAGGASKEDITKAYSEVKGTNPCGKTINRIISRINDSINSSSGYTENVIEKVIVNGEQKYRFAAELMPKQAIDLNQARLMALSLYPHRHQHQILADKVQSVTDLFLQCIQQTADTINQINNDLTKFVHIVEPHPANETDAGVNISKILDAIRRQKSLKLAYTRSYDGETSRDRLINPYGLISRHGVWYLAALNLEDQQMRVFRLEQVDRIEVVENSHYTIPADFSLQEAYKHTWGVWTSAEPYQIETVRLRVEKGMAVKFRKTKYHESQRVTEIGNGDVEVTFHIARAHEMMPWIMTWCDTVQVLEPQWLRDGIIANAKGIIAAYAETEGC